MSFHWQSVSFTTCSFQEQMHSVKSIQQAPLGSSGLNKGSTLKTKPLYFQDSPAGLIAAKHQLVQTWNSQIVGDESFKVTLDYMKTWNWWKSWIFKSVQVVFEAPFWDQLHCASIGDDKGYSTDYFQEQRTSIRFLCGREHQDLQLFPPLCLWCSWMPCSVQFCFFTHSLMSKTMLWNISFWTFCKKAFPFFVLLLAVYTVLLPVGISSLSQRYLRINSSNPVTFRRAV